MKNRKKIHDDWETPKYLLKIIKDEFGKFYDPCPINAKFNGLKERWRKVNYINPPYNLKDKTAFVKKAIFEASQGNTCILLLPASTETQIFMELWNSAHEIRLLHKRVCFEGYNTKGDFVKDKTGQGGLLHIKSNSL